MGQASKASKLNDRKRESASEGQIVGKGALEDIAMSPVLTVDAAREALIGLQPMKFKQFKLLKSNINKAILNEFMTVTDSWGFDNSQKRKVLGLGNVRELEILKSEPDTLSKDNLDKISCVFCIEVNLKALLSGNESIKDWLLRTHEKRLLLRDNKTPLERILSGNTSDIEGLHSYLAGICYH